MNNDYTKYDTNGYHDSHCEGPNCNCDSRRNGYATVFCFTETILSFLTLT